MKLVVGLGNPGRQYQNTRHNVGFEAIGELARRHGASRPKVKFEAEIAEAAIGGEKALLMAPQTFMNLSGRSVGQCVGFYQLPLDEVLVLCDDMNLQFGQLRLRGGGSAGGQKGLKNIIDHLGTERFARLRIGIGRPPEGVDSVQFVLGQFNKSERAAMDTAILAAADGVELWIRDGLAQAMNQVNAPRGGAEDD